MRRFIVGVMGPGDGASPDSIEDAVELGMLIAQEGWVVLTGGRDVGVMKAVNQGARRVAGSLTVGILPSAQTVPSPDVDIVIVTDMHAARNNINVLSSDVVVACGRGGSGTVSEIALALKAGKPVILLRADSESAAFFRRLGKGLIHEADKPQQVIGMIKELRRSNVPAED
jgi:uncharacterized protein (TIGR00725 family)